MIAKNKVFVLDYHVYFEREKKETLNHKLSANHQIFSLKNYELLFKQIVKINISFNKKILFKSNHASITTYINK